MRNVFKGYQSSKLAVPKMVHTAINKEFSNHHAPKLARPAIRAQRLPKEPPARRPGKNVGIKDGYKI